MKQAGGDYRLPVFSQETGQRHIKRKHIIFILEHEGVS
jgi:hypothetical protein